MSQEPAFLATFYFRGLSALALLCTLGLGAQGCGEDEAKPKGQQVEPTPDAGGQPACDIHGSKALPRFERTTAAWGLGEVVGNRISAVDLDGDDFPDLIVHAGPNNQRTPNGSPGTRILMNRTKAGGGRHFIDQTLESGYGATRDGDTENQRSAQLAIAADVDNDGDLDLFSGTFTDIGAVPMFNPSPGDLDRSQLLLNDGSGKFTLAPELSPHGVNPHAVSGASFVDVNLDGNIDLFVVGWYERYGASIAGTQARLYLGAGDGSFTEATGAAGLTTTSGGQNEGKNHRPAYGATACDVDNDGDVDLLISAYGRQFNQLYLNDGKGKFREVGRETLFAGDENLSYADNQFFLCWCTENSDPSCPEGVSPAVQCPSPAGSYWSATDSEPWRNNGNTFSTACGDVNGDGVADLYSAEIKHWWAGEGSDSSRLLLAELTEQGLRYSRPDLEEAGLGLPRPTLDWNEGGINAALFDMDLDGRKDILLTTSDYPDQAFRLFHQQVDGSFKESAASFGIEHPCAVGLAVADFDRDGDLDIVMGASRMRDCAALWPANEVHFYENNAADLSRWVQVKLEGGGAVNRSAIGAKVRVHAGEQTQVQELQGGYGHFGMQHDTVLSFGVGDCEEVELSVDWPDASRTRLERVKAQSNQFVKIVYGNDELMSFAEAR